MAVYAVGDVQGCAASLQVLLKRLPLKPSSDRLLFTGDLVNRGRRSADVLRLVADLGSTAESVLGNHDLHLLAVVVGAQKIGPSDSLQDVLEAVDRDGLIGWLRRRPLLVHDAGLDTVLIHAALHPDWDAERARGLAEEVERMLRGANGESFLHRMYGDLPDRWDEELTGWPRLRFITNVLTRGRFVTRDGRLDLDHKGAPGSQPSHLVPWFAAPGRRSAAARVVFGHWSTLGLWHENGVIGLDTGCVWGRRLTAVRLDSDPVEFYSVACDSRC